MKYHLKRKSERTTSSQGLLIEEEARSAGRMASFERGGASLVAVPEINIPAAKPMTSFTVGVGRAIGAVGVYEGRARVRGPAEWGRGDGRLLPPSEVSSVVSLRLAAFPLVG